MATPDGDGKTSDSRANTPPGFSEKNPRRTQAFGRGETQDKDQENKPDDQSEKTKRPPKKPFWKRPVLFSVMLVLTLLVIVGGVIWYLIERNYESTDDAFIDGHIIHVAPRVAGRVLSLNVDDNQLVSADTVVINIDPAPFQVAYDSAKATLQEAQAKVPQAQADLAVQQANAEQAKADVLVAQANAENAEQDLQRYQALQPQARTKQQLDNAIANQKSTAAQVTSAQKKVASAEAQVQASQTAIEAAKAQVAAAQAQVEQSVLDLQYTSVTAGQPGYVTRRTVEKGNYVQVGQDLMAIVPTDVWVTANFKETQLTYMKKDQPVEISVDAYPGQKYKAHVDSIQTGTGAVFSVLPPENATGNFVKIVQRVPVKIVFDEPPNHKMSPGESVEPRVDIRSGR